MILGLYPYINNEEGYNVLKQVLEVSANESLIVIREPIAVVFIVIMLYFQLYIYNLKLEPILWFLEIAKKVF